MDIWFLKSTGLFTRERETIAALMDSQVWLESTNWGLNSELYVDAVIIAHDHRYQVRLTYPSLFPSIPPSVFPIDPDERWSDHQYSSGALCLEWGPDNWHPSVTGAQMLVSTYNLLQLENPYGKEPQSFVPSRHQLTPGQELRNKYSRFLISRELIDRLVALPDKSAGEIEFTFLWQSNSITALVQTANVQGEEKWSNKDIPPGLSISSEDVRCVTGVLFVTELEPSRIEGITSLGDLEGLISESGGQLPELIIDKKRICAEVGKDLFGILLLDIANEPHFFLCTNIKTGKLLSLAPIHSENSEENIRIPEGNQALQTKSVGIVGLGSIGSKIAVSLARTGVAGFLLIDDDIFLPENVCRHELDWQSVGEHKVDGVAEALARINANNNAKVSRFNLLGQEATSSLTHNLNRLGGCDLIIDATADARVFNLAAAVSITFKKPLIWMEVYAGGTGGLIARSRPNLDPDPHTMRAAFNTFVSENPSKELGSEDNYTAVDIQGNVVVATDSDVGIIASHATRLAIDTLIERDPSIFPHSMYLLGLSEGWVFEAPFHTIPIATDHLSTSEETDDTFPKELSSDNVNFIASLLKNHNEDSPS